MSKVQNYDPTEYDTKRFAEPPWDQYRTGIEHDANNGVLGYFSGNWEDELTTQFRKDKYAHLVEIVQKVLAGQIEDKTNGALFFANVTDNCSQAFEYRITEKSVEQNKTIEYDKIKGNGGYLYYLKNASISTKDLICEEE